MKNILIGICFFINLLNANAFELKGNYSILNSNVDYVVKYLIKKADGHSTSAKGKGECNLECEFLIAVPVKSFQSSDSNRDLNMQKTTKAEKSPLIVVKFKSKTSKLSTNNLLMADAEVEFSGIKKLYNNIAIKITETSLGFKASGSIDLILENHSIEKPSLMGISIESLVPITFESEWKKN